VETVLGLPTDLLEFLNREYPDLRNRKLLGVDVERREGTKTLGLLLALT